MFGFRKNEELERKVERLERIVKYSKDEPTFRISTDHLFPSDVYETHTIIVKNYLHMYIDKEEYVVELIELAFGDINPRHCEFKVEGNFAYFTYDRYLIGTVEEFVIDYKSGAYVHRIRSKDKEEPKCTDC